MNIDELQGIDANTPLFVSLNPPREPKPVPVPAAAKRTGARRPGFDGAAGIKTNMRRFARKFGTAKERQQAIADNAKLNGTDARTYAVAGAAG